MSEVLTNKFPDSWGKLGEIPPSTPATLIGVGGVGEVYRWNKDGIQMAVKRIRVLGGCSTDIKREMNIVSQLRHKHIVQCYGVDRDANYVYIITDYAEGGNLDDAAPRLDWMAKKRIVVEVALGLAYLHSQGIIHRDIKGGNIVLTMNDEAKLCDFGIAKIIASATCGSSFVRKGTPKFMAPELMRAKPVYSTMSDIHALGVVMQELIHENETPADYMAIMKRCLNENPEKRPTVEEIVGAFDVDYRIHVMDAKGDQVKTEQEPSAEEDFYMGYKLYYGYRDKVEVNHVEGVKRLLRSASKGHTRAQYLLGHIYCRGVGVLRDFTKSVKWFQMAADKGFWAAQTELAKKYFSGLGAPQDYGRALDLFQAAANQESMEACKFLGWMYRAGLGAAQNNEEAMRWYRVAAERGSADSQLSIGIAYYLGEMGAEQDYVKSRKFLLMAASQGLPEAYLFLGLIYHCGDGVPQDNAMALKWWFKAAGEGNNVAQYVVGILYIEGEFIKKNISKGRYWLKKATKQGFENAQEYLEILDQAFLS